MLRKADWLVSGSRQQGERVPASGDDDSLPGHTSAMDVVEAVLVTELRLDLVSRVRPLAEQRWLVQRAAANELVVLDHQLTPIWRLRLPAGRLGFVAVAETCRWLRALTPEQRRGVHRRRRVPVGGVARPGRRGPRDVQPGTVADRGGHLLDRGSPPHWDVGG
jgi:hypothetical protein